MQSERAQLLRIYHAALRGVDGQRQTQDYLCEHPQWRGSAVLAIGKAAAAMAAGALQAYAGELGPGLVIAKAEQLDAYALPGDFHCLASAHPIPDQRSFAAGRAVLEFIRALPPQQPLLVLISGGASALAEAPAPGIDAGDIQRCNQWLLGSGLDIRRMNQIRQALSALKGGRLAAELGGRATLNLLISDVPGDTLHAIGSGPLVVPPQWPPLPSLPDWLQALLARALPPPPAEAFANIQQVLVASPAQARAAAAQEAEQLGLTWRAEETVLQGDASHVGQALGAQLRDAAPGLHIYSSETTVRLPQRPGRGGRCQHLALAAAQAMAGCSACYLLAAGTDGNDGPGADAGALVDGFTLSRGQAAGLDAAACLAAADAGRFLAASEDLLQTGPTGTNVMDLLLLLKGE